MNTPCYIIDKKELEASFLGFKNALNQNFEKYIPSYSVKTNSLPYIIRTANAMGYYAEVVSDDEYSLALKCGFSKDHIIFNGPMKSKDVFLDAVKGGALVNIETFRELEWLSDLNADVSYSVGIRMNINISAISPEDENHEADNSRFGFSCESGDFDRAIGKIKELPNIELKRIHIHRTSRTRSVNFYLNLLDYALNQLHTRQIEVEQIDIGGGYFGRMPNKPTYEDYARNIALTVRKHVDLSKTTVIIEPGNAIVASCFDFLATVIDVKQHDDAYYVTINGSRIDVDPFFRKSSYFYNIDYRNDDKSEVSRQIIGGCTCLENDRLMDLCDQRLLHVGDQIRFNRVGAYTMALTPLFIRYWPEVYVNDGQKISIVREKFDVNKLL